MIQSKKLLTDLKKQVTLLENDRRRFGAAAEETLAGIHEGNFARCRIRPSEFESWKAFWTETGSDPAPSKK